MHPLERNEKEPEKVTATSMMPLSLAKTAN